MPGETPTPVPAPDAKPQGNPNNLGLLQEGGLVNDLVIKPVKTFLVNVPPPEVQRALNINQGETEKQPTIIQKQETEEAPRITRAADKKTSGRARTEPPPGKAARVDRIKSQVGVNAIRSQLKRAA